MNFRTTEQKRRMAEQTLCVSVYAEGYHGRGAAEEKARRPRFTIRPSSRLSHRNAKCERRKLEFYQKSPNFRSVPPSRSTRAANDLQHPSLRSLSPSGFPTAESFSFGEGGREKEAVRRKNPRTPAIA